MFDLSELNANTLITVVPILLVTGGIWLIQRVYWERRITRWARAHHFALVDHRWAWAIEGPDRLTRTSWRTVFWIEVTDRDGFCRTGYLTFHWRWWGGADEEIEWN